jgi:quercetin dioxygenase-like cupin family protein
MRLTDLAEKASCSKSLLSKIENKKATPSLSLLHRLGRALGTNVAWFLTSDNEQPNIVLRRDERLVLKFEKFRATEGTTVERIAPNFPSQLLQALLFEIAPGGHSLSDIQHDGEELGYVLQGEFELVVNGQRFHLREGDAFQFRSEVPHGYRNPGSTTARVLWINTPPTY